MNMYTNTKKSKKFILILVLLLLFSFCYPRKAYAGFEPEDIVAAPAKIFWMLEAGVIELANNIFTDSEDNHDKEVDLFDDDDSNNTVYLTVENIIKGKFILFDANIFRDVNSTISKEGASYYYDYVAGSNLVTGRDELRNVISGWYYALRNFAIIALLSVLVYVGIRMILSTIAQDKAKYKTMFKDWLIALCLVVVMHYIMIGTLNICTLVTDAIGGSGENSSLLSGLIEDISGVLSEEGDKNHYTYERGGEKITISDAYAKIIVLAVVIFYMVAYAFKYLKREFTIIFLILLGPISCITYPIDKISDGKAQAFNKWLSEFIYQVLIQPFHLLLYIVLIGAAAKLAETNLLYSIVCFAVLWQSEKFVKDMFGFKDKLGSPLGAFAGGAMASKALDMLTKGKGGSTGGNGGGNNGSQESNPNSLPPKTVDKRELGGGDSNSEISSSEQTPRLNSGDDTESGDSTTNQTSIDENRDEVLEAYNAEGFGQNVNGEYYNPYTDEYDPDYDPHNDDSYIKDDSTDETNLEDTTEPQGKMEKLKAAWDRRAYKKNGGQKWKGRAKRTGKALLKGGLATLKGTAVGIAAAGAITAALATGNANQALAIAGGVGAYAGKKALGVGKRAIKGAAGAVKYYGNAIRSDEKKENKELKDFKADGTQVDKAIMSYKKNHDGKEPNYKELDQEMNDRFELSRYGLSNDQIDDSIGRYQDLIKAGMPKDGTELSKEKMQALRNKSAQQAAFESKLANRYKGKFGNRKDMEQALEATTKTFTDLGVGKEVAEANARTYLEGAAGMNGETFVLSANNQTADIDVPNVMPSLGVQYANLSTAEVTRMNNMTLRLHQAGYSNAEIEKIAKSCADSKMDSAHVVESYNTKVEFLTDGNAQADARKYIEASNKGSSKPVTDKQIKLEMQTRAEILSVGAKKEDLDSIRAVDDIHYASHKKSDKQMALNIASKFSTRQMNESKEMNKLIKDTAKDLVKQGRVSDNGMKLATEIVERAANFKGTTAVYTVKE